MNRNDFREEKLLNRVVSGEMLALLALSMLILEFNIQPIKADTKNWTVDDDGPADFHTIREAVNHASEGDTIYVKTGTYYEKQVPITKPLALIGENKSTTVVDGNGSWVCFYVTSTYNVDISGFTVRNGYGIQMYGSQNVIISGNIISNNAKGITLGASSRNTISENIVTLNRYPIHLSEGSSDNKICGNIVTLNSGDGIWLDHSYRNTICGNNISENGLGTASGDPLYGIRLSYSNNNTIYHNNITDNYEEAYSWMSINNIWDNGYPSGGNYWSDYCGVDLYSGRFHNETGSDGIGDAPYVIDENNRDRYPLVVRSNGYVGDLTIENHRVYYMSDGIFNLTGRLLIKDNASVRIQNAEFHLTCLADQWNWISDLDYFNRTLEDCHDSCRGTR